MPTSNAYSLAAARGLQRGLAGLDPAAPPAARLLRAPRAGLGRAVGVLPGSFDPFTAAHAALARAALRHGGLDSLLFLLSVYVVDKGDAARAALADRALVLARYTARRPRCGVAVANRGLYVEEAEALAPLLPAGAALWFVVGHDKIVQVFDPRYYADRTTALDRLFALAGFVVAPRAGATHDDLAALLARPENAPYRARVRPLPLATAYRDQSATAVRAALAAGEMPAGLLTPEAAAFIAATGCYTAAEGCTYAGRRADLTPPAPLPSEGRGEPVEPGAPSPP
jgi:nicotinic acid mononucleotide adenylyltransferase